MYYIVESAKSFDCACTDLETAVRDQGFGVLHMHDLGAAFRSKGIDFSEQCRVFEVCNPQHASRVLAADMRLNMVLPCRISVYTERNKTMLGVIRPMQMLSALSQDEALIQVAREVEQRVLAMVDAAR